MTVASLPSNINYLENGVTLTFAVPFRFLSGALAVTRVLADGTVLPLAEDVDFSVTGGGTDSGGALTLGASVAGARLRIRRSTLRTQVAEYTNSDRFPAASHESALDRAMMIDQEQDDRIDDTTARALLVPDGEQSNVLPSAASRAGKFLAFGPDGQPIQSSGTGADAGLRTDLANRLIGAALIGYSADRNVGEKLGDRLCLRDFGARASPAIDDTDAIIAALAAARSEGVGCYGLGETYTVAGSLINPGATFRGVGRETVFKKVGAGSLFANSYTLPVRQGYYLNNAPLHSTTITLSNVAHAANFAVDTYAIIASQAYYDTPNFDPQLKGEYVRIKSISGATITLYGPLTDDYLIGDLPELIPVTLTEGLVYSDFTCLMDRSVAPVGGADPLTEARQVITTRFALAPLFHNVRMRDSIGAGIALEGCIDALVMGHQAYDFGNATASDGTATDGFGGYGYGVSERGLNTGLVVIGSRYRRIRHGYTNGGSYIFTVGRPVGAVVAHGTHQDAKLAGWDTHQLGFGQRFHDLWTIGGMHVGFSARCNSVIMTACGAIDCLGSAVALYKGPTESAEECVVDGFYGRGNNWGDDGTTNWAFQGTFLDQGVNNTIKNFTIDSSYGPLYSGGPNAVNPTLRNGTAKEINKIGAANHAIWLRSTGATMPKIRDIDIDVSNGMVTNLVRNESSSFSNIPRIRNLVPLGSISGKLYSSALANDQFVDWTGPGFRGYREGVALGGATTFSINGRVGNTFSITRTAAEVLATITGPSVEGKILRLIGGVGGFFIQHGTGTDGLSCRGAANVSITESQSIEFERRGTVWVETWRSF
jgi:hypothetical protein